VKQHGLSAAEFPLVLPTRSVSSSGRLQSDFQPAEKGVKETMATIAVICRASARGIVWRIGLAVAAGDAGPGRVCVSPMLEVALNGSGGNRGRVHGEAAYADGDDDSVLRGSPRSGGRG
jgi:hypothetical protein